MMREYKRMSSHQNGAMDQPQGEPEKDVADGIDQPLEAALSSIATAWANTSHPNAGLAALVDGNKNLGDLIEFLRSRAELARAYIDWIALENQTTRTPIIATVQRADKRFFRDLEFMFLDTMTIFVHFQKSLENGKKMMAGWNLALVEGSGASPKLRRDQEIIYFYVNRKLKDAMENRKTNSKQLMYDMVQEFNINDRQIRTILGRYGIRRQYNSKKRRKKAT